MPEGVMMRSPNYYSVATRIPDGQIVVITEPLDKTFLGKLNFLKRPFLRGILGMLDTMILGVQSMRWAANQHLEAMNILEPAKDQKKQETLDKWAIVAAIVVSLSIGMLVFKLAPEALAQLVFPGSKAGSDVTQVGSEAYKQGTYANYFAEFIKILLFIGYLCLIRFMPAILDTFRYHGAEHKAINVIEAKQPLTVENAVCMTRLHPRCGTNFAIVVLIIGLLLFPLIPRFGHGSLPDPVVVLLRFLVELCILPLIAGISYEVIRAAGKAKDQKWVEILLKPGLATQLITTEEPTEKHIEVAIASLEAVMKAEDSHELTNVALDKEKLSAYADEQAEIKSHPAPQT